MKRRKDVKQTSPELLNQRLLVRVREYADLTGTPLPTVYALIAAGKIPGVVRIGSSIRIPATVLKELVA